MTKVEFLRYIFRAGQVAGWAVFWCMLAAALVTGLVLSYRLFSFPGDRGPKIFASVFYAAVCAGFILAYYLALMAVI